jgi:glucan phosphoethanolaminetransferase (alkaline phosphatase superfamily)
VPVLTTALWLGIAGFRDSQDIVLGIYDKTKVRLRNAIHWGASATLLFLAMIICFSIFDPTYEFNLKNSIASLIVSLFPGIIVFFGVLWRLHSSSSYRNHLIQKYGKRDE